MIASLLQPSLFTQHWQHFIHTRCISWHEGRISETPLIILQRISKNIVLNVSPSEKQSIFFCKPHMMHTFRLFRVPLWMRLYSTSLIIPQKVTSSYCLLVVRVLICSKIMKKDLKNFSVLLRKISYL